LRVSVFTLFILLGKVTAIHKNMTEEEKALVTMNKEKRAKKLGVAN
jgi:hypothetical protein